MKDRITKILLGLAGVVLLVLLIYKLYIDYKPEIDLLLHLNKNNEADLVKEVRSHGIADALILFLAATLAEAIPGLSNGLLCIVNGLLYGPWLGFFISWCADVLGLSILLFGMSFIFKKPLHSGKNSKLVDRLEQRSQNPWVSLTLAYFLPLIPNVTVNYANLHLLKGQHWRRLLPMIAGTAPLAALYAFGGDAIMQWNTKRILIFVAVFVVFIITYALLRWQRTKKKAGA